MKKKDVTRADIIKAYDIISQMQKHTDDVHVASKVRKNSIVHLEFSYREQGEFIDFDFDDLHLNSAFRSLVGTHAPCGADYGHYTVSLQHWVETLAEDFGPRKRLILQAFEEVLNED